MAKFKLYIAIPSTHTWESKFGMSLVLLCNYLSAHPIPGVDEMSYQVNNKSGSILASMRQALIYQAAQWGATHILFLDSDQTFPKELVHQLYSRKKQVIGCNIPTKNIYDSCPTARNKSDSNYAGDLVYTKPNSTGIEQVWRLGTGIMLINMNIFKRDSLSMDDLFPQIWNPALKNYNGEDWGFCMRLEEAGVKIWIDHDASKAIGHVGPVTFDHSFCDLFREVS